MLHPLGDLPDPGIKPLSLASPAFWQILYCWAIRYFNFMVVVSFKCYLSVFFFFNHEKVLKFLSCSLCINWGLGFSLRYVNVVHFLLACLLACQGTSVMSSSVRPPWTAAHQAPLSTGFSRHELWSGLPFSSPMWYMIPMHFTMMKHSCIPGKIALVYIVQFLLYELI